MKSCFVCVCVFFNEAGLPRSGNPDKNREAGYPRHRENRGNAIIAAKKIHFFPRSWIGPPSQFCVCNTHKLCKLAQGKFAVRRGKHGI